MLPEDLAAERAMIVPRLARVLWTWARAALELGENSIVTSGSGDAALFCLVATWRCGRAPVYLDFGDEPITGIGPIAVIEAADPQSAIERLVARLRPAAGTAAVVLHPGARALDILLESLPTWGRLLVATPAMAPAAIDFYNHVHRKGARLFAAPADAMCVFDAGLRTESRPHVERAIRILRHAALGAQCLQWAA